LSGGVLLDTLASGEPEVTPRRDTFQKGLDEGRLPDSRVAGHEDDLALAGEGAFQATVEVLQLRVATDDRAASARPRVARALSSTDRRDEAIPATMNGLDEPRHLRAVTQALAQLAHADGQDDLAHGDAGPDGGEQLVLGDQPVRAQGQIVQNCEGP